MADLTVTSATALRDALEGGPGGRHIEVLESRVAALEAQYASLTDMMATMGADVSALNTTVTEHTVRLANAAQALDP